MTRLEDALVAAESGADILGFIFHPRSPRSIVVEEAGCLIAELKRRVEVAPECVGVFVDREPREIEEVVRSCGLDQVQLHGRESLEEYTGLDVPVVKAYPLSDENDLDAIPRGHREVFLVDSRDESGFGGTGRPNDWKLAARAAKRGKMFLAGGLSPINIVEALESVHPYGVDASSRLEISPGIKDSAKVHHFIQEIRKWEARIRKGISDSSADASSPKR
jgi:phosphoribosylanthranilate isomerase